ncbi:MAG: helix-turn-helix domain-containing protein [Rikenellaceae bacterium]
MFSEIITSQDEKVVTALQQLAEILQNYDLIATNYRAPFNGEVYLTDKELSERLKICRRTLQEWRDNGVVSYIKLGGKILYAESAVHQMLEKNHFKAWR